MKRDVIMKSTAVYTKKADKANLDKAFTKVAYHVQQARFHLDQISTTELALELGLKSRQSLQARINAYKEEVTENAR